ncbi:MAG: hypothetical protein J6B07_06930 [Opitutales bacterium]|nr:hypothetical protein [Opitutales bacterium]
MKPIIYFLPTLNNKYATHMSIIKKLFFYFIAIFSSSCIAKVVTYPVPISEAVRCTYSVFVNGKELGIYKALSPEFQGGEYYFTYFDFDGEVDVEVKSTVPFTKKIPYTRPASEKAIADKILVGEVFPRSIKANVEKTRITFKQDKPFKAIILRNERERPLIIFGNPLETNRPDVNDTNVVYIKAGVHYPEKIIRLRNNQILYLEGGAVLKSAVLADGENITICGRGIISLDNYERHKGFSVKMRNCKNLTVKDVIIKDTIGWSFVLQDCNKVLVDNLKICTSRMLNDDAIDICNSSNVTIKNTFTRSQDDCIAIKGMYGSGKQLGRKLTKDLNDKNNNAPVENIEISDCIFWCDHANVFRIGYECHAPYFKNIKIKNIQIPYYSTYRPITDYWAHAIFLIMPTNDMKISDVHFENIEIRSNGKDMFLLIAKPRLVSGIRGISTAGSIENCSINNVDVYGKKGHFKGEIYVEGFGENNSVKNLKVSKVTHFNKEKTSKNQKFFIGKHTKNIKILQ